MGRFRLGCEPGVTAARRAPTGAEVVCTMVFPFYMVVDVNPLPPEEAILGSKLRVRPGGVGGYAQTTLRG
jgi:hypothetical protein